MNKLSSAISRMGKGRFMPGMGMPPAGGNNKIGFTTISMWGLCVVVVGVCYMLEQREAANKPMLATVPAEVAKVLPSGMWLMRDGSIQNPAKR